MEKKGKKSKDLGRVRRGRGRVDWYGGERKGRRNLEANQPRPQTTGSRKQSPGSVHRLVEPLQPQSRGVCPRWTGGQGVHGAVKCFLLEN